MAKCFLFPILFLLSFYSGLSQSNCKWNNIVIRNVVVNDDAVFEDIRSTVQDILDGPEYDCNVLAAGNLKAIRLTINNDFENDKNLRTAKFNEQKNETPGLEHYLFLVYTKSYDEDKRDEKITIKGYLQKTNNTEKLEQFQIYKLQFENKSIADRKMELKNFVQLFEDNHQISKPIYTNGDICKIYISEFNIPERCLRAKNPEILLEDFININFDNPKNTAQVEVANQSTAFEVGKNEAITTNSDIIISANNVKMKCESVYESRIQYFYEVLRKFDNPYIPKERRISGEGSLTSQNQIFINNDLKKTALWISYEKQKLLGNNTTAKHYLKSIISITNNSKERSDAYYLLIEQTLRNDATRAEIEECNGYYQNFINSGGQGDYRRRLKWLQLMEAIRLDKDSRVYADDLILNDFSAIFNADRVPGNFVFDEINFLFCITLAKKLNRSELITQILKNYPDKESFNYLLNSMAHNKRVGNESLLLKDIDNFNKLYPNRSEGYELLVQYYEERNRVEDVFRISHIIFKLDGLNADNNLRLAAIYFQKDNIDSAYIFCSLAKTVDPQKNCDLGRVPKTPSLQPCCYASDFKVDGEFDGKVSKFHVVGNGEILQNIVSLRKRDFPSITIEKICEKNGIVKDRIFPGQKIYLHTGCDLSYLDFDNFINLGTAAKKLQSSNEFKNISLESISNELKECNFGSDKRYVDSVFKTKWFYKSRCSTVR